VDLVFAARENDLLQRVDDFVVLRMAEDRHVAAEQGSGPPSVGTEEAAKIIVVTGGMKGGRRPVISQLCENAVAQNNGTTQES
jgi:hypothetical protein